MIETGELTSESLFLPVGKKKDSLHIRHFCGPIPGPPVLMIHGAIENGRIFYSDSGKGFGPYLARNGFDVYIPDMRGRGKSSPRISGDTEDGLWEMIHEDYPALYAFIEERRGAIPQHWISHSWSGVNILAFLARNPGKINMGSMVFFGTKRRITVKSLRKFYMINFGWYFLSSIGVRMKGYLDAKGMKMGGENKSRMSWKETNFWLKRKDWPGLRDEFDYRKALAAIDLPPTLYLAGANDHVLGFPRDVKNLMEESSHEKGEFHLIGKETGFMHDYGHIDMLTHKDAEKDHYPFVLEWMKKQS